MTLNTLKYQNATLDMNLKRKKILYYSEFLEGIFSQY